MSDSYLTVEGRIQRISRDAVLFAPILDSEAWLPRSLVHPDDRDQINGSDPRDMVRLRIRGWKVRELEWEPVPDEASSDLFTNPQS